MAKTSSKWSDPAEAPSGRAGLLHVWLMVVGQLSKPLDILGDFLAPILICECIKIS